MSARIVTSPMLSRRCDPRGFGHASRVKRIQFAILMALYFNVSLLSICDLASII